MMRTIFTILIIFSICLTVNAQENFYDKKLTSQKQNIDYLISLPSDYNITESKQHPVILFLHGGDGSNTRHHPKKYATKEGIDFPFIVIAPHSKNGISWSSVDFKSLVEEVSQLYRVDSKRIYITGYSYGGYGTWSAITNYPEIFAAAIPICGGGNPKEICNAKSVAVTAFHAKDDNVTPYKKSVEMIDALKKCNKNASLRSASSGGHGIWSHIYKSPKTYQWFLSHSK